MYSLDTKFKLFFLKIYKKHCKYTFRKNICRFMRDVVAVESIFIAGTLAPPLDCISDRMPAGDVAHSHKIVRLIKENNDDHQT
ncbi:MAG: hypothetical protein A3F43_02900 [Gammaproteobacteria bacterium RIFCSPHIGHO2_12_FULL_42_10]|nr:MAG: hypothetical protein A3F43_02900 [Gammaproteobacteria bacterium RIFCSPHIGHO2_12_FULL_42_10]